MTDKVYLDGKSLTPETLVELGTSTRLKLHLSPAAWDAVRLARKTIDNIVISGRTVYGINTGFGKFESTKITPDNLDLLQVNLIRSHCAGVGAPLPAFRVRRLLVLRINILARGHSGIRPENVQKLLDAFNAGVVPYIPIKGTVGASGDLAPLSHLALGLMGEGRLATVNNPKWRDASEVLKELGLQPITLHAKEGLALINGTQFIVSLGCEALVRARRIARQADIIAALTFETLQSSVRSMNALIHSVRPHRGQYEVSTRIRSLLHSDRYPSEISVGHANCGRVQDAYSLRCSPQVHGIVSDTIRFVYSIISVEMNSATDNPLIFPNEPEDTQVLSGGNFHGEYPAKVLDMLAIAIHELAGISERRIERLNNPSLSRLPAFLIQKGGLNSGFMIAHCTAASLVSENKVLTHPASVDSISTSAAQEDHVSMGGFAARKAIKVVENVEYCLAIELLCACQGIEFLRPKKTTEPLEKVVALVRSVVPPWTQDRDVSVDTEKVVQLLRSGAVWDCVKPYIPTDCHLKPPPHAKL